LAPSPLRLKPRDFFFCFLQLYHCDHSPYETSSLRRGLVSLLWIGVAFVKCVYRTL
jgi:hypothetical protein